MSRAEWLRSILRELGFEPISKRIEYQLPLLDAIARLEAVAPSPRLTWMTVPTEPGPGIEHAARILRTVGENAPESVIHSDPVGFLLSRREDRDVTLSPESLQIGFLNENEAAIVAASAIPTTGWCTLFYLGVVPAFRRKRIGTEAMLHGLRALQAMGGRTYHDGTDTRNAAMLSLFERLRVAEFRELEEWERSW
jgi:ribosomal protein S18 acetylase RimI-like enzyme